MAKPYEYVGPKNIRKRAESGPAGERIESAEGLRVWVTSPGREATREGLVAATFVTDEQGELCVADRRTEHISCSGGRPVLSAGEMFFEVGPSGIHVAEVTNQSTGFCPEPESWPAVAAALDHLGVLRPNRFTQEIAFRLCPACGQRNIVKDGWFVCATCGADLPREWNFERRQSCVVSSSS